MQESIAKMKSMWLSKEMKRYIISHNEKYKVNDESLVLNRTIAKSKTTREGCSRADTSDYIAPSLQKNTNVGGYSMEEIEDIAIRKLTPKECWRLMGFSPFVENEEGILIFDDQAFERAEKVCSNSQLYKQAGNSIVVNVLVEIFKQML